MTDLPVLTTWTDVGGNVWEQTSEIVRYTSLHFSDEHNDDGEWTVELPFDELAQPLTAARDLAMVEFRGWSGAYRIRPNWGFDPETGERTLEVSGAGTLDILAGETAWPEPGLPLAQQTLPANLFSGTADSVIRQIVRENYVNRAGDSLEVGVASGLGSDVVARGKFTNLRELVVKKAEVGGVGVDVRLVRTSESRARLELIVYAPRDLTADVTLSESLGTLAGYRTSIDPPTLTHAIVPSPSGYTKVTTPESLADAAAWGEWWAVVESIDSFDQPDIVQAGEEALKEGRAKISVALEANDAPGLVAFRDYQAGDLVSFLLEAGLSGSDVVSAIETTVEVSDDGVTVEVVPKIGDPEADDPYFGLSELIRSQDRRLRAQERKG